MQGYCESLRSELASGGVSVHVVSPGYVRTDLSLSAVMGDGRSYSKMDETTANGTFFVRDLVLVGCGRNGGGRD